MANRSDNFNRSDTTSGLGTPSDGGSNWVAVAGTWGISSNQAYESAGGSQEVVYLESDLSDVDVQVTLTDIASKRAGVVVRRNTSNQYLLVLCYGDASLIRLWRQPAGDLIQGVSQTVSNGDVFKVTASGSSVKVYQNGNLRIDVTETHAQTGTRHGLRSEGYSGARWDDFSVTGLSVPRGGPPQRRNRVRTLLRM